MQRVALIVVEQEIATPRRREIGQASGYGAGPLGMRVGITHINLTATKELRRSDAHFPTIKASARDGQRKKDVRISDRVVIEIIPGALVIIVHFERPAANRNAQAELVFFIAFASQGNHAQSLRQGKVEQWACHSGERRRLIIAAPKAVQNPIETRNANRSA